MARKIGIYFQVLWAALWGRPIIARVRFRGGFTMLLRQKNVLVIDNQIFPRLGETFEKSFAARLPFMAEVLMSEYGEADGSHS